MRTVLLQNFHPNNTIALAKDFMALGYEILMPDDSWIGQISYYHDNKPIVEAPEFTDKQSQIRLVSYGEYQQLPPGDIICGCYELQDDVERIAVEHKDRIIIHTAGNDVPYRHGLSEYMISPDIITFHNYPAKYKMLYLFPPSILKTEPKDLKAAFDNKEFYSFNHFYRKYWHAGWAAYNEFIVRIGRHIPNYGHQSPDGTLTREQMTEKLLRGFFTIYFKDRDCYGQSVLESMAHGTPVVALRPLIHGKTLGVYFLDDSTAILGGSVAECMEKLNALTFEQYETMCKAAQERVKTLTDTPKRLARMKQILNSESLQEEK